MATYTVLKIGNNYRDVVREKDENGKSHQKKLPLIAKNMREAKREAIEVVAVYLAKKDTGSNRTLTSLLTEYIEKTALTPTTKKSYKYMLDKHIAPYFQNKTISELNANHFSEYYRYKAEKEGLSGNSVIKHHQLIHAAYEYAINGDLINKNPTDKTKKPRVIKKEPKAYTLDDYRRLNHAAKESPIYTEIFMGMVYGPRRSEVLGLRWSAIDWEHKKIYVSMSVTRTDKQFHFSEAMKTDGSIRKLDMNDNVINFLKKLRAEQQERKKELGDFYIYEYDDFICVDYRGDLHKPDYVSAKFKQLIKENGFPPLTFHGLRHSFITILLEKNYPAKAVQKASGHTILSTTYEYSAVSEEVSKSMIDMTSSFLLEE